MKCHIKNTVRQNPVALSEFIGIRQWVQILSLGLVAVFPFNDRPGALCGESPYHVHSVSHLTDPTPGKSAFATQVESAGLNDLGPLSFTADLNAPVVEEPFPKDPSDFEEPFSAELYGDEHIEVVQMLVFLAFSLEQQGKLADAELNYRQALAIAIRLTHSEDPSLASVSLDPSFNVSMPNLIEALASVLRSAGKIAEVEQLYFECLPTLRAKLGADDPELVHAIVKLANTLVDDAKFIEAEPFARECLASRERVLPDDWRTFNSRCLLGASLLGQGRYEEAEPLLLSGYEGMKQREKMIPPAGKARLQEAIQRLVQLYEETDQLEQAAEWRQKLTGAGEVER